MSVPDISRLSTETYLAISWPNDLSISKHITISQHPKKYTSHRSLNKRFKTYVTKKTKQKTTGCIRGCMSHAFTVLNGFCGSTLTVRLAKSIHENRRGHDKNIFSCNNITARSYDNLLDVIIKSDDISVTNFRTLLATPRSLLWWL